MQKGPPYIILAAILTFCFYQPASASDEDLLEIRAKLRQYGEVCPVGTIFYGRGEKICLVSQIPDEPCAGAGVKTYCTEKVVRKAIV